MSRRAAVISFSHFFILGIGSSLYLRGQYHDTGAAKDALLIVLCVLYSPVLLLLLPFRALISPNMPASVVVVVALAIGNSILWGYLIEKGWRKVAARSKAISKVQDPTPSPQTKPTADG